MLLSICYPSYNRGSLAYEKIEELLSAPECNDVRIIISNNGSTENTEGYERIATIQDPRLKYYQSPENRNYWGNIHQVIKMADTQFCMIVSDEDHVITKNLPYYLEFLEHHKHDLAFMKAAGQQYNFEKSAYYPPGKAALGAFYMAGNYVSGIIYNREIITDDVLDCNEKTYIADNNIAYIYYPHMMLDAYAMLHGAFASSNLQLIDEGPASVGKDVVRDLTQTYSSVDSRIMQMLGFEKQIANLQTYDSIKLLMMKAIILKTFTLCNLQVVKDAYNKKGYDWGEQLEKLQTASKTMITNSTIPIIVKHQDVFCEFINAIMDVFILQKT